MHDGKVTYYIGRTVNTESAKARHKANPNRNHLQFDVIKSNLSKSVSQNLKNHWEEFCQAFKNTYKLLKGLKIQK